MASKTISLILGTTRNGRMAERVGNKIGDAFKAKGHSVNVIDPGHPDNRFLCLVETPYHHQQEKDPKFTAIHDKIVASDCVVLLATEYNYAPPPALLAVLDNFYHDTWGGRKVALASYSAQMAGGARALFVLRNVVAELNMHLLPTQFNLPGVFQAFDDDGNFKDERSQKSLERFVGEVEQQM